MTLDPESTRGAVPDRRVLLKLSGETFGGGDVGLAADVVQRVAAEIAEATAREEGKPEAALAKIVEGRVNGFYKESVLLEQAFAKDNKKTVAQVLAESGGTLTGFVRYRVGA